VVKMTDRDWRPRYIQLAEELRQKIESGALRPDTPMPSEADLADSSGLSRTSVRNAIRQLREWGLVRAEQGRGTFIRAARKRVVRKNTDRYQWEKNRVHETEKERRSAGGTEFDTGLAVGNLRFYAEYRVIEAPEELAELFGISKGAKLLQRDYHTTAQAEEAPLGMSRSYIPHDIVAQNPALLDQANEPWPGGTQHQLFTVGIELDSITDHLTARPPLPHEAELLGIESGVSVIAIRKVSKDTAGRVVEIADAVYAGDRAEMVYEIMLERWNP